MRLRSLAVVLVSVVAACGGPTVRSALAPVGGWPVRFERDVYPFEVVDHLGRPYAHPFLGGFNLPRPQLVDVDGDGDLDLFVQEYSNDLMFFERVGSAAAMAFRWRTDRYQNLRVGEWFRFADMDGDGDLDLLTERPFSYVQYFRNEGTGDGDMFVLAADTLRDVDEVPIFSDRQNIPNIIDLDCDGYLDLFVGRLTGTVARYEETRRDPSGIPRFKLLTERFEDIEIVATFGSRHGANTLTLADVDQDGDADLFWGDFFEAGLLKIENHGTCQTPDLRGTPQAFPPPDPVSTSGYNAPTFGDTDLDGDLDLVIGVIGGAYNPNRTSIDNLLHYVQESPVAFRLTTSKLLDNLDVGSESVPALVDLDADGDLDLLVANKIDPANLTTSRIFHFENRGTAQRPRFHGRGAWDLEGAYHYAPTFGDLDGDGDLDMIMGSWSRTLALYRNDGSRQQPRFTLVDSAFISITRGSNTTPVLVDIDADGDLDLFIGEASGTINYYRNDGGPNAPQFTLVSDEYAGIRIARRSAPTFVDLDGDGVLDMIVGLESGPPVFVRNEGTRSVPRFGSTGQALPVDVPPLAVPVFGDLDGDGDLDLLIGNAGGGLKFFWNRAR